MVHAVLCHLRETETASPKELDIKTEFSSSPVQCGLPMTSVEENPYTISISVPAQD